MNTPYHQKFAEMQRAAKPKSLALLADNEGYIAFGKQAALINDLIPQLSTNFIELMDGDFDSFPQGTITLPHMEEAMNRLTEAGHSVSLLDRYQDSLKTKPRIIRVLFLQGKAETFKGPEPVLADFC